MRRRLSFSSLQELLSHQSAGGPSAPTQPDQGRERRKEGEREEGGGRKEEGRRERGREGGGEEGGGGKRGERGVRRGKEVIG